ncbi:hypothetical protein HRR90_001621 [Exophiala dermatitidis]|nr:hypothetical protein HRR74_002782 [Exophiala dermatitidis]KAJ4529526.1 hypothetical protein HRR73_000551 [Exophiala dermatitidis]KAJ4543813.1 hypothetical protein HRR76_001875 [Exophiala dermatitidis]KAJ4582901.1 hypothetical protein HRR81_001633 [Exophiala dermatitidis]KAJ4587654.1 hypothetical protein HRR82_001455 [Exophiala dermatitidis]
MVSGVSARGWGNAPSAALCPSLPGPAPTLPLFQTRSGDPSSAFLAPCLGIPLRRLVEAGVHASAHMFGKMWDFGFLSLGLGTVEARPPDLAFSSGAFE